MTLKTIGLIVTTVAGLAPVAAVAQTHSRYATARTYLREAQMFMRVPERPNVQLTLKTADDKVAAAVKEIDLAGVVSRKDRVDSPVINAKMEPEDRFQSIVDLLRAARFEIQRTEDNPGAQDWRSAASKQIDDALAEVHRAAIDAGLDRQIGSF